MMDLSGVIEFCEERMEFKPFVAQVSYFQGFSFTMQVVTNIEGDWLTGTFTCN